MNMQRRDAETGGVDRLVIEVDREEETIRLGCFQCKWDEFDTAVKTFESISTMSGVSQELRDTIRRDIETIREMLRNPDYYAITDPMDLNGGKEFWLFIDPSYESEKQKQAPGRYLSDDLRLRLDAWPIGTVRELRPSIACKLNTLRKGDSFTHKSQDGGTMVWVRCA